ncbi:MAG TPA: hypothetical protein VIV55_10180 [Flavobacterium sp.]
MKAEVEAVEKINGLSSQIDIQVGIVLADNSVGIQKAVVIAHAMQVIDDCLTPEIMQPIMRLQGSKLGFKTDKDLIRNENNQYVKGPGYPLEVVKNCFIEMSLIGLQPVFNQWNIIGGNSYVTKEGADILLKNIPYLQEFLIIHEEVNQSPDKKIASVKSKIKWVIDGEEHNQIVTHPVKSDAYTTLDSLVGKADRKTKIWLFNKIKGTCISDGDAEDAKIIDVTPPKPNYNVVDAEKTRKNIVQHIKNSKTKEELERATTPIADYQKLCGEDHDLLVLYEDRKRELAKK